MKGCPTRSVGLGDGGAVASGVARTNDALQEVGAGAVIEDDLFEGYDQAAGVSSIMVLIRCKERLGGLLKYYHRKAA